MFVLYRINKFYTFLNEDLADPRFKDLFLVGTLWQLPCLIMFYISFVNIIGPKFMEKREPYKLDRIIQIYNFLQIIFNSYVFYLAITLTWLRGYSFQCEPVNYSYEPIPVQIGIGTWYYFLLKILDLLDTVFFILKKKQSHVSFLHVYHHGAMLLGGWVGIKYLAGGESVFLGTVNTFVHSVMYTYYLLTSMKIKLTPWKKYITQLQIIQFIILLCHYSQLFWTDCGYPSWIVFIFIPQNLFMIILFIEFYNKTYIYKKPTNTTASTKEENISAKITNSKLKEQ